MSRVEVRGEQNLGPTLLFLIFLVLKLTHEIDWSWWWVTAPLWIPLVLLVVLAVITGLLDE